MGGAATALIPSYLPKLSYLYRMTEEEYENRRLPQRAVNDPSASRVESSSVALTCLDGTAQPYEMEALAL
jgi:hypothetical protein